MKTSSLFVVGLLVGALAVFGIRAVSDAGATGPAETGAQQQARAEPDHAGHEAAEQPAPVAAPDPAPTASSEHDGHDARKPENEICPVMGNEVDPEVYVDHKGRRIGFCCPGCDEQFLEDPEKYLKKVDAEIAARQGAK